jgi:hypothetical protein
MSRWLSAFVVVVAVCGGVDVAAEEGPPPPPLPLDEWIDPAADPTDPAPATTPTPAPDPPSTTPAAPAASTSTSTTTSTTNGLPGLELGGPVWGTLVGVSGAVLGASVGVGFLLSDYAVQVPDFVAIIGVLSVPALSALAAGSLVLALVVENPTADEFGGVLACSALGCAGTWFVLALGLGGGCSPGSCGNSPNCGDSCLDGGSNSNSSDRGLPAAAAAGIGSLAGLLLGGLVANSSAEGDVDALRVYAAVGLMAGAVLGGGVGGFITGVASD